MHIVRYLLITVPLLLSASVFAEGFSSLTTIKDALQPNMGLAPVHGTLLPDGRIMFFGSKRPDGSPIADGGGFEAALTIPINMTPLPATIELDLENAPLDCRDGTEENCNSFDATGTARTSFDLLFCSGHTLLEDGNLFTLSGTRYTLEQDIQGNVEAVITGMDYNMLFNSTNNSWSQLPGRFISEGAGPTFGHGRWYGTGTRLHDGRILMTGGYDVVFRTNKGVPDFGSSEYNISTEIYDPATGTRELISSIAETPASIFNPDYSHVFQLPWATDTGQDIVILGEDAKPVLMQADSTLSGNIWEIDLPRPGTAKGGNGASTLMLPIRFDSPAWGYQPGALMMIGGGNGVQLASADVLDFGNGGWTHSIALDTERHHPSTTILPDGKIFVVGGHPKDSTLPKPTNALLIDPANNFSVESSGQMATTRGYHTVSLLLPDGRVLVAGGRTGGATGLGDEQPTMEIYSPPYMDAISRPVIDYVPDVIKNQEAFLLTYSGANTISEIVLIGLGSMTHSFDQNTRSIQVYAHNAGAGIALGYNLFDNLATPPGKYMLFILDENRIPSEARIVQVAR